jgi:hypothetical protein
MRRREVLKLGVVVAAIPVGASLMWERCKTREDHIREKTHEKLKMIMCAGDEHRSLSAIEAYPFVDDVMDMTFSLVAESPLSPEIEEGTQDLIKGMEGFVVAYGEPAFTESERCNLAFTIYMVRMNYSHQVSGEALEVLISVALCAKYYQIRPDVSMSS